MTTFKIMLEGKSDVGKTRWVQCLLNNNAEYTEPTKDLDINEIIFNSNYGDITVEIWELPGLPQMSTRDIKKYYDKADAVIIMTNSRNDDGSLRHNYAKNLPKVLVYNGPYSSKYNSIPIFVDGEMNLIKPFQVLLRSLTKHGDLTLEL